MSYINPNDAIVTRIFLPVGQGAFYVERFIDGTSVVYDCGSLTKQELLKRTIDETFKPKDHILAIFISHLHYDHISGLPYLLSRCKNIDYILIPDIDENEKKILLLYNKFYDTSEEYEFANKLINDAQHAIEAFDTGAKLIRITEHVADANANKEGSQTEAQYIGNVIEDNKIKSGKSVYLSKNIKYEPLWIYIPYNYKISTHININEMNINDMSINDNKWFANSNGIFDKDELFEHLGLANKQINIKDLNSFISNMRDICYTSYGENLNRSTTLLYSGPPNNKKMMYSQLCSVNHAGFCNNTRFKVCTHHGNYSMPIIKGVKPGCLYTGDFNLSNKEAYKVIRNNMYKSVWESIGVCQVPHHGAEQSYNYDLSRSGPKVFIISVGEKNKFGHPSKLVIEDIEKANNYVFVVNECKSSEVRMFCIAV